MATHKQTPPIPKLINEHCAGENDGHRSDINGCMQITKKAAARELAATAKVEHVTIQSAVAIDELKICPLIGDTFLTNMRD